MLKVYEVVGELNYAGGMRIVVAENAAQAVEVANKYFTGPFVFDDVLEIKGISVNEGISSPRVLTGYTYFE